MVATAALLPLSLSLFVLLCADTARSIKGGYWPSYAASTVPASQIHSSLFTHICFAFAGLDPDTFQVQVSSDAQDSLATFAADVRTNNSAVRALLSIGGGDANATTFAKMSASASTRRTFISSAIATARQYDMDGLDIDWEHPDNDQQMSDFATLLAEWRDAIDAEANSTGSSALLLTAAVYFASSFFAREDPHPYPAEALATNLDWLNVMSYDLHGAAWEPTRTGALAPLYDPASNLSVSYGIGTWLATAVPAEKLVLGMPMYGATWLLQNATADSGIGAPAVGPGPAQNFSRTNGSMYYSEIATMLSRPGSTEVFDEATVSAYAVDGDLWVSYDNPSSITVKWSTPAIIPWADISSGRSIRITNGRSLLLVIHFETFLSFCCFDSSTVIDFWIASGLTQLRRPGIIHRCRSRLVRDHLGLTHLLPPSFILNFYSRPYMTHAAL